jgi:hypothetical protein
LIPEERQAEWKRFLDKYPPLDDYQPMGLAIDYQIKEPIKREYTPPPPKEWEPLQIKDRTMFVSRKFPTYDTLSLDFYGKARKPRQRKERRVIKKSDKRLADLVDCSPHRINEDGFVMGDKGMVIPYEDKIQIQTDAVSKRKHSSHKKQLSFMKYDGRDYTPDEGYRGRWSMSGTLTPEQAKVIRKVVGVKQRRKTPTISENSTY